MKKFFHNLLGGLSSFSARRGTNDPKRYRIIKLIGQGTFGSVYEAKDRVTGQLVAIKKVETAAAESELAINLEVCHPNAIRLLGNFEEKKKRAEAPIHCTCLVLEYSKTTLRDFIDTYRKKQEPMSHQMVRLLTFQMFRVLHYLHQKKLVHRDVKPSNFLLNEKTYALKISDFGSAKRLVPGEARSAGVCSAPYRAPELELGNEDYNEKIDIWAGGCIVIECVTGEMLFRPVINVRQYDLIRALLGDPTAEEVAELQPLLKDRPVGPRCRPTIDEHFAKLNPGPPPTTMSFVKKCLTYSPSKRPSAIELLADPFYDYLRKMNGFDDLLYNFFEDELQDVSPGLLERIVPPRCRNQAVLAILSNLRQPEDPLKSAKTTSESKSQKQAEGGNEPNEEEDEQNQ